MLFLQPAVLQSIFRDIDFTYENIMNVVVTRDELDQWK